MDQFTKSGPLAALSKFWSGLTPAQKATVSACCALSIVAVFIVSLVATRPSKAVLFSGLQSQDAGAIVAKLEEKKVPYELSGDGSVIKVPEKDVHNLRLAMATEGLPQGGNIGFELFDKSNFGMTEFSQRLNYQRALQGELCRTISQLSQVSNARVHIAIPEEKLYTDEKQEATASVVLKLRPGVTLGEDQVAGIVHLVASSIEGMKPNNVTVVDTNGTVLSEGGDESGMAATRLTTAQAKLKRDYERNLQRDLQSMLDRIVGSGKSIVRVSADMNFDHKEVTNNIVEPLSDGKGVLVSEERKHETYNGSAPKIGGAPGVANNLAGPSIRKSAGGNGDSYDRTEDSATYEVTKRVEQVVSAPGDVEKLCVAVMLDEKVEKRQIPAIEQTMQAAAGISRDRGDMITVQQAKFDNSEAEKQVKEMASAARSETYSGIGKNVLAVLLLVGFMLFLRSIFKQMKVSSPVAAPVEPEPSFTAVSDESMGPELFGSFDESIPETTFEPIGEPVPMSEAVPGFEELDIATDTKNRDVADIARRRPEDVARLIKDWMTDK